MLVPLASRGYIKREESIPYIMGANITTLADTLVAAMVLGNPVAVHIVLAEAIAVSFVSLLYLALLYGRLKPGSWRSTSGWCPRTAACGSSSRACSSCRRILLTSGIWIGPIAR